MTLVQDNFDGVQIRLADIWQKFIPIEEFNRPIKYLEIGVFYGANAISVGNTYAKHPDSKLYCIDPWEDYNDYPEYKNEQNEHLQKFIKNAQNSGFPQKFVVNKTYSHIILPTYENDFFEMIYIDGNHEPDYVIEDAILSLENLNLVAI